MLGFQHRTKYHVYHWFEQNAAEDLLHFNHTYKSAGGGIRKGFKYGFGVKSRIFGF